MCFVLPRFSFFLFSFYFYSRSFLQEIILPMHPMGSQLIFIYVQMKTHNVGKYAHIFYIFRPDSISRNCVKIKVKCEEIYFLIIFFFHLLANLYDKNLGYV